MRTYLLEREQWLPRPVKEVFAFFSRAENLQSITPPWLDFRMVETPKVLTTGSRIHYRLRWRRMPIRWTTEISDWNPPQRFVDRELSGPYALWNHEHEFTEHRGGTMIHDRVTYALPFGPGDSLPIGQSLRATCGRFSIFARKPCAPCSQPDAAVQMVRVRIKTLKAKSAAGLRTKSCTSSRQL